MEPSPLGVPLPRGSVCVSVQLKESTIDVFMQRVRAVPTIRTIEFTGFGFSVGVPLLGSSSLTWLMAREPPDTPNKLTPDELRAEVYRVLQVAGFIEI